MKFASSILFLCLALTVSGSPTTISEAESVQLYSLAFPDSFTTTNNSLEERGAKESCFWGVKKDGKYGYGCYCASGCKDPLNICNLNFGKCHGSGALKLGGTALGGLIVVGAVSISLL